MGDKIGFFDSSHDLPEEIIVAAGFTPVKILGDVHKSTDPADQYLFKTFCPLARSILTEALESPNKWAGIVIAHGCDATNRQFDIWKYHVKTPFLYWLYNPLNDSQSARKFFKQELKGFITALEKQYNITITSEKIKKAIKESNEIKNLLKELANLRNSKDISNVEYLETVKKAVQMDKSKVVLDLKKTLTDWKQKKDFPNNKKKIVLTGSDVTYPEFMQILEDCNLRVVRDDLSIGERYFATSIPVTEDPLDGLITYHFNIPRPATKNRPDSRLDYLFGCVKSSGAKGMVYQNIKFCEVYTYDSVFIVNAFRESKIPVTVIEREYTSQADQQLVNRLEAFSEIL
jgi:benzoyl-CoA reductase/2-hydroxyglutaryl-CoA dehydratase subunit BcrC/BadD/HgdB